ncbi:hypothetical protein BDZ91DRAFT_738845 [Kalaharituber pfeilii]|nr:hypothetical protein BDZ91DRAFT_738845 [Kalaharituber pfeilii]
MYSLGCFGVFIFLFLFLSFSLFDCHKCPLFIFSFPPSSFFVPPYLPYLPTYALSSLPTNQMSRNRLPRPIKSP